jgi:cell wall-associated NlpC family hydrolase
MKNLIETPEDEARVIAIARSWDKTPYIGDGAVKGFGCSCSSLPAAVLAEFGHLAPAIPKRGLMPKVQLLPTMRAWLEGHPEFYQQVNKPKPGDVLLCDAGIGHMAIVVDKGEVMHSNQNAGVHADQFSYLKTRLVGIWRPVV